MSHPQFTLATAGGVVATREDLQRRFAWLRGTFGIALATLEADHVDFHAANQLQLSAMHGAYARYQWLLAHAKNKGGQFIDSFGNQFARSNGTLFVLPAGEKKALSPRWMYDHDVCGVPTPRGEHAYLDITTVAYGSFACPEPVSDGGVRHFPHPRPPHCPQDLTVSLGLPEHPSKRALFFDVYNVAFRLYAQLAEDLFLHNKVLRTPTGEYVLGYYHPVYLHAWLYVSKTAAHSYRDLHLRIVDKRKPLPPTAAVVEAVYAEDGLYPLRFHAIELLRGRSTLRARTPDEVVAFPLPGLFAQ